MPERRRAAILAAACVATTCLVFLTALIFPFLDWDDGPNVVSNPHLYFDSAGFSWMFSSSLLGHWHPLTWMTFALDRILWNQNPLGYHLTNVLLHSLNAALVFMLARRLFAKSSARPFDRDISAAFAALLWSLHPLRVESVAWISERRDVLSGAFILASVLAYIRGADEGENARGDRWRLLALGFGAAAMASKVFAVMLPFILLVLDVRLRGKPRWPEKVPWLIPMAVALVFNLAAQSQGSAVSLANFGVSARLWQAAFGLAFYLRKSFVPTGLAALYEYSFILNPVPFVASAICAVLSALFLVVNRRRFPSTAQAFLCYLLLLSPALGLFKSGRMTAADRYSYLPMIPLSLLAGAAFSRKAHWGELRALGAAVLLGLAFMTRRQLWTWHSDAELWVRACAASPVSYFARMKLSSALAAAGDRAGAEAAMADARAVHYSAFTRAAGIYAARGDETAAAAARARAERGLELVP